MRLRLGEDLGLTPVLRPNIVPNMNQLRHDRLLTLCSIPVHASFDVSCHFLTRCINVSKKYSLIVIGRGVSTLGKKKNHIFTTWCTRKQRLHRCRDYPPKFAITYPNCFRGSSHRGDLSHVQYRMLDSFYGGSVSATITELPAVTLRKLESKTPESDCWVDHSCPITSIAIQHSSRQ